ncbi:damage-control phosphatase ARMT1 family protein [Kitasatospora sp. NPDC056327]|uniref:damage-control phosphatase ARMT1 family protein n=1 Tax=Kitasatospora sp. NPDC056327 TaxID=3345785 RepID=UPI0035DF3F21
MIRGDAPGSFARSVFHERHPVLVRRVLGALPYGPGQRDALERLLRESTDGVLEPPAADAPDAARWREWGEGHWGRPWGEAPFLWAESHFYHRLLEATGYFGPGAWRGVDPFAPFKDAELAGAAVDDELAALDGLDGLPDDRRARALLASAVWGNRADLGFRLTARDADPVGSGLLVDDGGALLAALDAADGGRVCVVADNAGRELLPDLVLIDHLLAAGRAARVVLYVKPQPYFVSDATTADALAALGRLRGAPARSAAAAVGDRLWRAVRGGALDIRTHPFFCAPLPFHDMPGDLRDELTGAAMTVLKGDLNYRRLVGDRLWPPTTPFAALTAHFPTPVAALRTLKSDVAVGLGAGTVAGLDATGTPWRTSGRYAVVQVAHPQAGPG